MITMMPYAYSASRTAVPVASAPGSIMRRTVFTFIVPSSGASTFTHFVNSARRTAALSGSLGLVFVESLAGDHTMPRIT